MNQFFIGVLLLGILQPGTGMRKHGGPREELERLQKELRAEPQQVNVYTTLEPFTTLPDDQTYDGAYASRSTSTTTTTTTPGKKRVGFLR